jgi:hypothetical protein
MTGNKAQNINGTLGEGAANIAIQMGALFSLYMVQIFNLFLT